MIFAFLSQNGDIPFFALDIWSVISVVEEMMDGSWMFSLPGKIHLSAGIHRFIFNPPGKSRILTNQQYSPMFCSFRIFWGVLPNLTLFFLVGIQTELEGSGFPGPQRRKPQKTPSVDFRVGLENLQVMWSDLVQGKPELDDSLSSNAKQMKVASRCFSFLFPNDMFVCFSFLGKDSPGGGLKAQKRFAGAKQGATGKMLKPSRTGDCLKGGWRCLSTFFGPDLGASSTSLCSQSWDFFGCMLIIAHPPSSFPLACQHPPKKLFKILLDVVSSFKLQHGNSKLETFEARRHVVEFCRCLISFKAPWCHWISYLVKQSHWQLFSRKYLLFYYRVWNLKEHF